MQYKSYFTWAILATNSSNIHQLFIIYLKKNRASEAFYRWLSILLKNQLMPRNMRAMYTNIKKPDTVHNTKYNKILKLKYSVR